MLDMLEFLKNEGVDAGLIEQVAAIFGFAALIYFIINFTLSCLVRYIQNRRAAKTRGRGEPAAAADKA